MKRLKRHSWYALIVLGVSAVTHFVLYGYPAQVVFDEVHFGHFAAAYLTHSYFFDIHPPFAKLLIALTGWITGFNPSFSFATIGMPYPNAGYLALRLLPTLAGILLPVVIYYIVRELDCNETIALLMGLAFAVENSLIVESRFILTDSILLLMGFLSVYFFLRYWNRSGEGHAHWGSLFAAGIFAAFACGTKWVGLAYLGLAGLFFLFKWTLDRPFHWKKKLKDLGIAALALVAIPAAIYVSLFAIHFAVLNKSGTGDAFQSPGFQKTLAGSAYANDANVAPLGFWGKFIELNHTMYTADQENLVDPYASKWYEWPFMNKPVLYWVESFPSGAEGVLYFVGNPALWAFGFVAIIFAVFAAAWLWIRRGFGVFARSKLAFVVVGYLASFLPLALIGRILFLYHYSPAFIFSLLAFALGLQWLWTRLGARARTRLWITLLAVICASFLLVAPFTYGTAVPRSYLHFFSPLLHDQW